MFLRKFLIVREIGLDDAILMYLNGFENKILNLMKIIRRLYELLPIGEGNGYIKKI